MRQKDGNPWGVEFRQGLFNLTSDSGLFRTATQLRAAGFEPDGVDWVARGLSPRQRAFDLVGGRDASALDLQGGSSPPGERYVPLYEAKMIHQFDHRWSTYELDGETDHDATLSEKADPNFEPILNWTPFVGPRGDGFKV